MFDKILSALILVSICLSLATGAQAGSGAKAGRSGTVSGLDLGSTR